MSRRIDVELTSSRADGVWTWRAAGARQPKGELDGALLYEGAKVGDVLRADADFGIEGIAIVAVLPPKGARAEPERLQIIGPPRSEEPGVTTVLAPKGRGRRDRDEYGDSARGPRRDAGRSGAGGAGRAGGPGGTAGRRDPRDRTGSRAPGEGGAGGAGDRGRRGAGPPGGPDRAPSDRPPGNRDRRDRPARAPRPAAEIKAKPKRLKAGRTHRQALLKILPDTHRPIADLLMRGGIPSVRQALDRQNELLKNDAKPEIRPEPLLDIADRLMTAIKSAEWRDKAEAALAAGDDVDIKDLRSVVVAADTAARDEESRALASQLREAVAARVDREHQAWLAEIAQDLSSNRLVRALRLSSRPPKAGAPFPADLARRLVEATSAGLTAEITGDRFATLLDALAFSPVRLQVQATSVPESPSKELLQAVKKAASRVPQIATQFGLATSAAPRGPRPLAPKPLPPKPPAPVTDKPATVEPTGDHISPEGSPERSLEVPATPEVPAMP